MSVLNDDRLVELIAEGLYYRSVATFEEAPMWPDAWGETRTHWREIAQVAVDAVRTADGATT
jgi:hypothetical protein